MIFVKLNILGSSRDINFKKLLSIIIIETKIIIRFNKLTYFKNLNEMSTYLPIFYFSLFLGSSNNFFKTNRQ